MLNSTTYPASNLYNPSPIIGGVSVPESSLPIPLQQLSKSMNYYNHTNYPPLKDDSSLTFNNNSLPKVPRKRPRESSINGSNNCSLIPVPTGKVSGQFLGEDLSSLQLMQHQLEVDRLIWLHMERVRTEMEERRRKQSGRLIKAIQEAVTKKLKEKEEHIEKMGKLNWWLEERINSLYMENQIWRDLAQTNEATANALRTNLEQVISGRAAATEDVESSCGSSGEDDGEEVEGRRVLRWRKVEAKEEERERICRRCGAAEATVLLLPCRHLCICSACGPAVHTCPICNSTNNATVHVNLC